MSEYRNDPTIDFLLDKDSKDSEDYANRYDQHIRAMTAERLNAKSDIAWELTIRDQRIDGVEAQLMFFLEEWESCSNVGFCPELGYPVEDWCPWCKTRMLLGLPIARNWEEHDELRDDE